VLGWTVAVSGFNVDLDGPWTDAIYLSAEPLGVQTRVSGLAVDSTNGLTFDQARLVYQPAQPEGTAVAGFELVVDSSDAGYVVTTTTLLPKAQQ
jgi:hypothetical protein